MKRATVLQASLAALLPLRASAQQTPLTEVNYVTGTASTGEWVTYIAQHQGFFANEGLHVSITYAGSPPSVTQAVATGAADIGHNGMDSWIVAIAHNLPVRAVSSLFAVNTFDLVVAPEIKSWDDLRGKTIMLGTKQDITAIVLTALAGPHGLKLDDFSIAIGGNSTSRFAALTSGNAQAAILTQPFDVLAVEKGYRILGSAVDTMKEWTSTGLAINPTWGASHRTTVVKFLRAIHNAARYGYTHKAETVGDLVAEVKVDVPGAQRTYDDLWTRWHVYDPDLKFPTASFAFMTKMQVALGILSSAPSYGDCVDLSYLRESLSK
jgi:ABC-type nitrate/sulfonate/bicarbonate transport system substrate-binding protein